MVVSLRIKTIGDFIEKDDVVVDVGADHGLLELYLIAKHQNIKITAVENKTGPYMILENNLKGLKDVTLSLSDGIASVNKDTKTVVIAGMGGLNIKNILNAHPEKLENVQKIVIDAHRDIEIARRTIINYGFEIKSEKIVYEQDKFYIVSEFLKCEKTPNYDEDVLQIGYHLQDEKLWPNYQKYLIEVNQKTIDKIKDLDSMQDKVLNLKKMNERLKMYGKN